MRKLPSGERGWRGGMGTFRVHCGVSRGWQTKLEREWSLCSRTLKWIEFDERVMEMLRCKSEIGVDWEGFLLGMETSWPCPVKWRERAKTIRKLNSINRLLYFRWHPWSIHRPSATIQSVRIPSRSELPLPRRLCGQGTEEHWGKIMSTTVSIGVQLDSSRYNTVVR